MFSFEVRHFDHAEKFLEALRPVNWTTGRSWSLIWRFRGHGDSRWLLRPSAWRHVSDERPHTEAASIIYQTSERFRIRIDHVINEAIQKLGSQEKITLSGVKQDRLFEVLLQAHTEYILVKELLDFLDDLGVPSPNSDLFTQTTTGFIATYTKCLFPTDQAKQKPSIWMNRAFALAQHHGIPTRLLDWTSNPLTAGYFAAESANNDATSIAVYAVPYIFLKGRRIATFKAPRSEDQYLHAQAGLLTLDQMADRHFIETGEWLHLEQAVPDFNQYGSPDPVKMMLPISEVSALLRLLWLENVTRAHLMPTLDNAVIALRKKWQTIVEVDDGT